LDRRENNKIKSYKYSAYARAAKPFMTYQQVFGTHPAKDKVINAIESSDLERMLVLTSQFASMDQSIVNRIKYTFLDAVNKYFGKNTKTNQDEILFASQAILNFYKWLLAYGKHSKVSREIQQEDVILAINLFLEVSDFLPKDIDPDNFLLQVLSFSKHTNLGNDLARAFYIYAKLSKQENIYQEKEFVDINRDFANHYGYTIEQYLAVNFALMNLVLPQRVPLTNSWKKSIKNIFRNTQLDTIGPRIIEDLSISIDEAKDWSYATINNSWDFLKIQQYPLLKLNSEEFIPFNYDALSNGIFDGLFYRIRECYPASDKKFLDFFGRPFEKYIEQIIMEAIRSSRYCYEYIEEFDYGEKSQSLSSDFYLRLNEDLIIIEAKGTRLTVNSSIKADNKAIRKDLEKLFIDPIIQADKTYQNIMNSKFANRFKGIKNIYIISVNINNFPSVPSFYEVADEKLKSRLSNRIKGYFNFSITDIEAMCYLISRKGKKPSIFKYLKRKFDSPDIQSFSWFMEHSSIPIRRSRWVNQQLYKSYEAIYKMSFENPSESIEILKKRLLR
jgi:hypothetical protein